MFGLVTILGTEQCDIGLLRPSLYDQLLLSDNVACNLVAYPSISAFSISLSPLSLPANAWKVFFSLMYQMEDGSVGFIFWVGWCGIGTSSDDTHEKLFSEVSLLSLVLSPAALWLCRPLGSFLLSLLLSYAMQCSVAATSSMGELALL